MIAYPKNYVFEPVWMISAHVKTKLSKGELLSQSGREAIAAKAAAKQAAHAKSVETRKKNAADAKSRNKSALEDVPLVTHLLSVRACVASFPLPACAHHAFSHASLFPPLLPPFHTTFAPPPCL